MAFQSSSLTFAEELGTEVIDLFVGPERKRYVVHKKPLTSQSEYFRNCLEGGFKEAQENSVHLEEDDPAAVALLIGWVYRGVIPGTEMKISAFAQPFPTPTSEKALVPLADSINGSQYQFMPTAMTAPNDSSGMREFFQNLCLQPQYQMFSQEELRLADYAVGRKSADYATAPTGFGGFGVFGRPPAPRPGTMFPPVTGFGVPVPPLSGATGATPLPAPPPNPQSTNIFGIPRPTPPLPAAPIQSASSTSASMTSHPVQTAQPSLAAVPTQATASTTPQTAASSDTSRAGDGAPASNGNVNLTGGVFGSRSSSARSGVSPGPGTISLQSQLQQSSGLFGTAPSSSLQNQQQQASFFGTPTSVSQTSSLFGNSAPTPPQTHQQQTSSIFGAPSSTPQIHHASSVFSMPNVAGQPAQTSGNMFAHLASASSQIQPPTTYNPFGGHIATSHSHPIASPFGSGSAFAGRTLPGQSSGGLFGPSPSHTTPADLWGAGDESAKRPGSFGYTPLIEHPKSPGAFIPGIPRSRPLGAQTEEQESYQTALLYLCILAERVLWPTLFNAAIEAYVRGELNFHRPIPFEHVDLIYERTYSESTLRGYVLESMCTNRGDSLMYMELTRKYDDLMEDILNKLPSLRVTEKAAPWTKEELIRSFHMDLPGTGKGKLKEGDVDISGVFPKKEDSTSG